MSEDDISDVSEDVEKSTRITDNHTVFVGSKPFNRNQRNAVSGSVNFE